MLCKYGPISNKGIIYCPNMTISSTHDVALAVNMVATPTVFNNDQSVASPTPTDLKTSLNASVLANSLAVA